ncbi:MAG: hypothetical protein AAF202_01760 [Pseudomonadota bacterium]
MKTAKPWVKALNVKFQEYETWTTQLSEGQSITFWALDHGKLRTQDYLYWAREHYKIPVIKDGYFRDNKTSSLYHEMKSVANWSEEMIPIAQWDNIIYIACVEPPEDVNWSFQVRYVLASARSLKTMWTKLIQEEDDQRPIAQPATPVAVVAAPAPGPAVAPPPPDHVTITNVPAHGNAAVLVDSKETNSTDDSVALDPNSIAPEGISNSSPSSEEDLSVELAQPSHNSNHEMPEGMNFEVPPAPSSTSSSEMPEGINFEAPADAAAEMPEGMGDVPEGMPPMEPPVLGSEMPEGMGPTDESIQVETPEGVVFQETASGIEDPTAPPPISLEAPPVETEQEEEQASEEPRVEEFSKPAEPVAEAEPDLAAASGEAEFPTEVPSQEDDQFEDLENSANDVDDSKTHFGLTVSGINQIAPSECVVDLDRELPASIESAKSDKEVVAWAFNELKQSFAQSMILMVDDKNLKAWKWESVWSPKSTEALESFSADKPGVFRIVIRTKQPYHGFIVESPANKEFFDKWGFIDMPKHATVMPLEIDGHMFGMALCVGEETSGSETNLMIAERTITELSKHLKVHVENAA